MSASSADLRSATESAVEGLVAVPAKSGVRDEPTAPAKPAAPRHPAPQDQAPLGRPAGDVVRTVTEGLTERLAGVQAKVPPLGSLPDLPDLPDLPALPALPTAPESPAWPSSPGLEFPGLPGLPGTELPGTHLPGTNLPALPAAPGQTLPAPVTGTPQSGSPAPGSGEGRDGEGRRTGKEAASVVFGPRFVAEVTASHAPVADGAHRDATSGYAPARPAPVDHPGGVLGNRSAGDSGTSRHGDAHAVSLSQRAPLRLVPGAAARVDADEIQDRHRDIPVSPA
ncbi:hypothetical protein [Streptomyces sp. SD31]|uniref:hypothetical protein n=1 Tax=Streptomyces sp. SD31 TaxID=3452208 RepID=UPI003F895017